MIRVKTFDPGTVQVSSVLSAIGLGNFLGRIFGGKLLDIFGTKKFILGTIIIINVALQIKRVITRT